jgi:ATP-dependent DNA ligase
MSRQKLAEALTSAIPMEAASAEALPEGPGWWFEPKWDGFRCLVFRNGGEVILQAKSGKSLTRFFPEVAARLAAIHAQPFALDGELLIADDGRFSFEALQMRLHPAESRIRKLAAAQPATLAVFDMLVSPDGRDLRARPLSQRREAFADFIGAHGDARLTLTPGTEDRALAQSWLDAGTLEGVVAKRLDDPYAEGERAMLKVKRLRTADCVVGGFRYGQGGRLVGSLLLGLYNDQGLLDHVGFTSGFANLDKAELTGRLESLRGGPGFTGDAPGGPSRWSTERSSQWEPLRPELVVEVSFDHVSGGRFRHGTRLVRLRPDKAPAQCRMEQIL